jgi:hypothetical protein
MLWLACNPGTREQSPGVQVTKPWCQVNDRQAGPLVQAGVLAGTFDIELRVTSGLERDSVVRGQIVLARVPDDIAGPFTTAPYVVHGSTSLPLDRIGDVWVSTSPSSQDPRHPGVLGFVDRRDSTVVLALGTADSTGTMSLHSGLYLRVLSGDSGTFGGRWSVETLRERRPEGVFCAWRMQDSI